jgi:hypothetical protein
MKSKVSKELWLYNATDSDVSLSDLGVKVPSKSSVNVYKYNPYLTEAQVQQSMEDGSLAKRLAGPSPILRVVQNKVNSGKEQINQIKISGKPIIATHTKTSVVIDPAEDTQQIDGTFDFADYGVESSVVESVVVEDAVVVKAKTDTTDSLQSSKPQEPIQQGPMTTVPGEIQKIEVINSVSMPKAETPAKEETPTKSSVRAKENVKVARKETQQSEALITINTTITETAPVKTESGSVVMADTEFLDSLEPKGMRVASRSKNGITVMKIKE